VTPDEFHNLHRAGRTALLLIGNVAEYNGTWLCVVCCRPVETRVWGTTEERLPDGTIKVREHRGMVRSFKIVTGRELVCCGADSSTPTAFEAEG